MSKPTIFDLADAIERANDQAQEMRRRVTVDQAGAVVDYLRRAASDVISAARLSRDPSLSVLAGDLRRKALQAEKVFDVLREGKVR